MSANNAVREAGAATGEAQVIALCNQKGGVGKTTSTVNLGAALAEFGLRVLLVDLDPQGALSAALGVAHHNLELTVYDLLSRNAPPIDDVLIKTTVPNQLDCLVRLQLGEVDAVVTDGALAASQAAQDPTVELKGSPFTTEYYGVAMKSDADDLVRRVNQILVDYRQDTTNGWQASYDRWLSATLAKKSTESEPPPPKYLRKS